MKAPVLVTATICVVIQTIVAAKDEVPYENPIRNQEEDLITHLPGLNSSINFKQYSGYLNAGYDGDNPTDFLHYWLVESQNNPAKDPLLLWLNGGPGCSSLGGFFGELGPFSVNDDGDETLSIRSKPWNKNANVIFLESPTGVGFSYTTRNDKYLDDDSTAEQNHLALVSFMKKFPQFNNRPFYISGESYGGVYLPMLGVLLNNDQSFNFKGIAIGNGYFDVEKLGRTLIFYGYYHGLYGKSDWDLLSKDCCNDKPPSYKSCDFNGLPCVIRVNSLRVQLLGTGLNPYNYAAECKRIKAFGDWRVLSRSAATRDLVTASLNFAQLSLHNPMKVNPTKTKNPSVFGRHEPPCQDDTALIKYLDSADLRQAIHIPTKLKQWEGLCANLNYTKIYPQRVGGLAPQMQTLIESKRNLSVLIYNGDLDMVCNFYGGEQFSDDLNRKVVKDYSPWYLNDQVAGFFKTYEGFTFATVKGAGHMVPTDKEAESLEMITKWLLV